MEQEQIIDSKQEQATAAWINYLNQVRVDELVEKLGQQRINFTTAMESMDTALKSINGLIASNRGGPNGLHGFIAEVAEVGVTKAREQIIGNPIECDWVNTNGVVDIVRNGVGIQQKFYQSGDGLSLDAIRVHLEKYPDFLDSGYKYQIPKEQYEKMLELLNMPADVANKLPTDSGEFSFKQWKFVHEFFGKGDVKIENIEASKLGYKEVQAGKIDETLALEKRELKETDHNIRDKAYEESKPNLTEGIKVVAVSAAIEGGVAFCKEISQKRKQGIALRDFDSDDWLEVLNASGKGTLKGGLRGAGVYILSNYTTTPAFVATAIATAAFGVAEQTHLLRSGKIDEITFINNSESLCLDVSMSALSSLIGQAVIPVPILGAIIGNTVGTMMYQIAKDNLSEREEAIIKGYLDSQKILDVELSDKYEQYIELLKKDLSIYMSILNEAFSPNLETALNGSIKLAVNCGVPSEEILNNREEIESYFRQ